MAKTKKVVLANDLHNTEVTLRVRGELSKWQVKRARKALCGIAECCCSDDLGTRGPQWQPDGRLAIVDGYDGIRMTISLLSPGEARECGAL